LLSCADNEVGNEGAVRLAEALQLNTTLTSLSLYCTQEREEEVSGPPPHCCFYFVMPVTARLPSAVFFFSAMALE